MARPAPNDLDPVQFPYGPEAVTGVPDHDGPVREQLSALRSMLVLAMLLTQQDSVDSILHHVANAVESLGSCTTEGIFLDGRWQDVRIPGRKAASLPAVVRSEAVTGVPDHDGPVREQLSALRSMLVLAMLLTQQDSVDSILHHVANAVESLGSCTTEGIFLDGRWQDVRIPGRKAASLPAVVDAAEGGPVTLADVPWSWAYSLSSRHGPTGYVVVGAPAPPAESERFLLRVLAQQAGVALAKARLHSREREQAGELRLANFALVRSMEIHERLTKVALGGEGQAGIAQAVYELTDRQTAIEDRFGNLLAWAGPDRPDPYPKAEPAQQDRLLDRAMCAAGPGREGERLLSVAALGGSPVAVLVLHDPAGTAAGTERMAVEHATTVLTMEIARLQHLAQGEARTRINLVLDLAGDAGAEPATLLNRAQALGYDLVRPHRVVVVEVAGTRRDDDIDLFFHAVGRAARAAGVGSLLAPRLHDVIVLADAEVRWDLFWARVVTEMHGGRCRIGVGGRVLELDGVPHSCQEIGRASC